MNFYEKYKRSYDQSDKGKATRRAYALANRGRIREHQARYRNANKEKRSAQAQCYEYGISMERRDELFADNGGRCAICRREISTVIDHDHETGVVRGALCRGCNLAIGYFKDNTESLLRAIQYLNKFRKLQAYCGNTEATDEERDAADLEQILAQTV